jgi:hypothetical protein
VSIGSSEGDTAWGASEWTRPKLPSIGTVKIGIVLLEFQDYPLSDYYPTNEAMFQTSITNSLEMETNHNILMKV